MLEIAVCSLTNLIDYPQNLTNADILGQGNLNLVSEKSGKSQGILLSIICGNPVCCHLHTISNHCVAFVVLYTPFAHCVAFVVLYTPLAIIALPL